MQTPPVFKKQHNNAKQHIKIILDFPFDIINSDITQTREGKTKGEKMDELTSGGDSTLILKGAVAALKDIVFNLDQNPNIPIDALRIILQVKIDELEKSL